MSGQTRAQLEERIVELRQERDAALASAPNDVEAAAIARCVRALDPLVPPSSTYGREIRNQWSVRRVLHYLAQRHGFTLYDEVQPITTYEECPSCRIQRLTS